MVRSGRASSHPSEKERGLQWRNWTTNPALACEECWTPRPGWWRPLHRYTEFSAPLTISNLSEPTKRQWIQDWIDKRLQYGSLCLPIMMYPGALRANQGYLTKMPRDWVDNWPEFSSVLDQLADEQERLAPLGQSAPAAPFQPKDPSDYRAIIAASEQIRTRHHERLVAEAARELTRLGASVSNPHPIDLLIGSQPPVILEAKLLRPSRLCILLDGDPGKDLREYAEDVLGVGVIWLDGAVPKGGPKTAKWLL